MSHDLRQALGYRRLTSSDPVEMDLRDQWYKAKIEWETMGHPDSGPAYQHFQHVGERLSAYLWDRASRDVEADRRKHPKAKRNQPVPKRDNGDTEAPNGRVIP